MSENNDVRTPGQLIESLLRQRGWTKRSLAIVLNVGESTVARIIGDKQPVDAKLAVVLEEIFGVQADRFLSLQMELDLAMARFATQPDEGRANRARLYGDLPIAEMIKRGWLAGDDIRDTKTIEAELMRFFGVNRPEDIEILPHAAKKTAVNTEATPAQLVWLYRVQQIAKDMLVPPFSVQSAKGAVERLRPLLSSVENVAKVPRILAEAGIRFVVVESLSAARIDGVCFWLDDRSPVIGMSLRFDRNDNFWFVLRHELEHVIQGHGKAAAILDAELEGERAGTGPDVPEEERVANEAAQEFCIPQDALEAFVARKAPFFSERDLIGYARLLKVHPGILAGQLQRATGRYDRFRDHLAKVRHVIAPNAFIDGWGDVAPVDH